MIHDILVKKLQELTEEENVQLMFSDNLEHGDYTTNIAMVVASKNKDNPRNIAEDIIKKLREDKDLKNYLSKIEVAGPGFINFFLSKELVESQLNVAINELGGFGKSNENKGRIVVVEYSSPNIAKPFTVGHLRSTIIGDSIANFMEATGWGVKRDNHLGDWGTQFGKQIAALKYIDLETGEWNKDISGVLEKNIKKIESSTAPVKLLVNLYVMFHSHAEKNPDLDDLARTEFSKLENGDAQNRELWQKCIDWSWREFSKIYESLGVTFTENDGKGYGESFFEDKMSVILDELREKKLLKNGEHGAKLVFFENEKYPPLMILKKDGSTLYATRDLATDKFRLEKYGKEIIVINEVGAEQSLYWEQIFELENILGWYNKDQRIHIKHGLFRFKDKKMSTRKGNVIWLEEVLEEAYSHAKELGSNDYNYKIVAIGALKWNELKRDPLGDIVFDWEEILNMKGNSGPYMQYTAVRAKSLLDKSEHKEINKVTEIGKEELELSRILIRFPEVISLASANYSPSTLCTYLYEVAQNFNRYYDSVKIIGEKEEKMRLNVVRATNIVLTNGLNLLGILVPEKM